MTVAEDAGRTTGAPGGAADRPFAHAPEGRTRSGHGRILGLDVTRAVALIGVVVMNYHGYLNRGDDGIDRSWAERLFDPWAGVLSTRFAATFVLVAGMGVTLLTQRSTASGDRAAITADRWRLARRGLLLATVGAVLEWVWPGTILFFYGAYFMLAALLFTLRTRWLVAVGALAAVGGAAVSQWRAIRLLDGASTAWLDPDPDTPRNLLLRIGVGHTHPVLPWLAFLCAGMVIGRLLPDLSRLRPRWMAGGVLAVAVTYTVNALGPDLPRRLPMAATGSERSQILWAHLLSTRPLDRGLLYTIGTLGSSIVAFCAVSWIAELRPSAPLVVALRRAGQLTLSLYVLHVLVFNAVVHWWGWVTPTGLDTALVLSLVFWASAIAVAAWWHRLLGTGPLEHLYRGFGG